MRARHLRHLITLAAAAILAACGGGGGGSSPTTRAPLPQVVSDTNPVGDRIDLRSRNYFPAAAGDSWTYDYIQNGVTTSNLVTRTVGSTTAGPDGSYDSTITVPKSTPVGSATATATCGDVTKVLNLNVTAAAADNVSSGTLARTGSSNTQTLLGVGAGLVLLGGTLAIGARRTRKPTVV